MLRPLPDAVIAMLARAMQGATMGIAAVLVIARTSPVDQGYFFAFISLGVLLQLCDFGLSYASLQAASQLMATGHVAELGALKARALKINLMSTAVATVVVLGVGVLLFAREVSSTESWVVPMVAFIAGVAVNHLTAPFIFIVEGGVSVAGAWRFRLLQEAAAGCALIVVLAGGFALWALVAYYWVRCFAAVLWMHRPEIACHFVSQPGLSMRRWVDELWPFQWRVGIGAISSFLVFQAFGPILFKLEGPAEAGRFSLSLAVMHALVMVTTAWPISQAAHFGILLGRHDSARLATLWTRVVVHSTAFAAVGAASAIAAFLVLGGWFPQLFERFADATTTALLIATAVVHHVVACFAVVLRSERRDPLLLVGIVGGLVTVIAVTLVAAHSTLDRVALTYLVTTTATVPVVFVVYRRFAARRFKRV